MNFIFVLAALAVSANAYWLMGIEDFITTERLDPVVTPGKVSSHVHSVLGGSNFRMTTNTAALRQSSCTSIPIPQDKSAYWFPHLYFQWNNGSFTSLNGGAVIVLDPLPTGIYADYLFSDNPGTTTAFPDDFRMISGTPSLRTYDPNSFAQQAVSFLCLDFNGVSTKHTGIPPKACPSGIRAQINFPSCWDGKNTDSADHKSHVSYLSGGPDSGTCSDPKFPITLPRIFIEVYWDSHSFDSVRGQAMNSTQPFVFSNGDPTGFGYHADYIYGWDTGVLQNAVNKCHCNEFGDPTCCVDQGIFNMNQGQTCRITKAIDEITTGTIPKLPGNNPVVGEGHTAATAADSVTPGFISPIYAYTGDNPTQVGKVVSGPVTAGSPAATSSPAAPASSSPAVPASSSAVPASSSVVAATSAPVVATPPVSSQVATPAASSSPVLVVSHTPAASSSPAVTDTPATSSAAVPPVVVSHTSSTLASTVTATPGPIVVGGSGSGSQPQNGSVASSSAPAAPAASNTPAKGSSSSSSSSSNSGGGTCNSGKPKTRLIKKKGKKGKKHHARYVNHNHHNARFTNFDAQAV